MDDLDRRSLLNAFSASFVPLPPLRALAVADVSNNVAADLSQLKSMPVSHAAIIFDGALYRWTLGNFQGLADDIDVVKQDTVPLSAGAWTRQESNSISFVQADAKAMRRSVESKLRETVSVADFGAIGDYRFPGRGLTTRLRCNGRSTIACREGRRCIFHPADTGQPLHSS